MVANQFHLPHTRSPPNAYSPHSAPPISTSFLTLTCADWLIYTCNSTHWHTPTQVTIYIYTYVHKPMGQFLYTAVALPLQGTTELVCWPGLTLGLGV